MHRGPKRLPPFFYEPLRAEKSRAPWRDKPLVLHPSADPEAAAKLLAQHADDDKDADWIIWGGPIWTGPDMLAPADESGQPQPGAGVICRLGKLRGDNARAPHHADLAQRIAECVNALAGVREPAHLIEQVKRYLQERVLEAGPGEAEARLLLGRMGQ